MVRATNIVPQLSVRLETGQIATKEGKKERSDGKNPNDKKFKSHSASSGSFFSLNTNSNWNLPFGVERRDHVRR